MTNEMINERYLDMLIQQSYSNEEKAGAKADSVADKIAYIKDDILRNKENAEKWEKNYKLIEYYSWLQSHATDLENIVIRLKEAIEAEKKFLPENDTYMYSKNIVELLEKILGEDKK